MQVSIARAISIPKKSERASEVAATKAALPQSIIGFFFGVVYGINRLKRIGYIGLTAFA